MTGMCGTCCRVEHPGFVRRAVVTQHGEGYELVPCPDCGGTMLARYDVAASQESITDRESSGPASALVGRELGVALVGNRGCHAPDDLLQVNQLTGIEGGD